MGSEAGGNILQSTIVEAPLRRKVISEPDVRPIPRSPQPEKPKKKSWIKSKTASIVGSVLTAVGLLGGVAYVADHYGIIDIPGIHGSIDVPSGFDNAKDSGAIGSNNIINIDMVALANIDTIPAIPTPKHDINLLTPFQGLPSDVNIDYSKRFTGQNQTFFNSEETKYAEEQNIKDEITFKSIPKNSVIPAPMDGSLEFTRVPGVTPEETVNCASIYYKSSDGIVYQLQVGGRGGDFFKQLIEAMPFGSNPEESLADREKKFVSVKRGQPILETLQTTDLHLIVKAWPSGKLGVGATETYPNNINLITLPDNLEQNKIAILEK